MGGDYKQVLPAEKIGGYKTKVNETLEEVKRLAIRTHVEEDKNLEIYREWREYTGKKTHLHGPVDYG